MKRFLQNNDGATSIEYGLIAGFISISMIVALATVGDEVRALFGAIAAQVTAALSSV